MLPTLKANQLTTFNELGLAEPLIKAIAETGYETPTPIQLQAIPPVLTGKDVLGIAQTGTGKTAAFALPILHRLAADRKPTPRKGTRALVLSPTRELATQIAESFRTYGRHLGFSVAVVFGGVSERPQADRLSRGVDILVATPGRLLDHMSQRNVSLEMVEVFVLDEADQMLDLGFFKPIRRIVSTLSQKRQSLFFSATMPKEIEELTRELLRDPVKVAVTPESTTVERVSQKVILIEQNKKKALLAELLSGDGMFRTLVFTRTKRGADRVAKHLTGAKIEAAAIHGNKSQNQREAALASFREGRTQVLVATDIAARGIDIDSVTHVVNFELPEVPEAYVHRIGRTARAGASGSAVSFCDGSERHLLRDIERVTRQQIEAVDRRNDATLVSDRPSTDQSFTPRGGVQQRRGGADRGEGRGRPERKPSPFREKREARGEVTVEHKPPRPMGEGEFRPREDSGERRFSDRGDRKPRFDRDRPPRERAEGERGPRQFEGRGPRRDGGFRDRDGGGRGGERRDGDRPQRAGGFGGGRPPFRGDRADRPQGDSRRPDGERRDFAPRGDRPDRGDRPPRGDRPFREHGGDRGPRPDRGDRPPRREHDGGQDRPWSNRPPRAEGERSDARPPRDREFRGPRPDGRGERRDGGGDRPRFDRSRSDNTGRGDERPRREGGAGQREHGARPHSGGGERRGGDKPWQKGTRPAGGGERRHGQGGHGHGGDRPRSRPQEGRRDSARPREDAKSSSE